MRQQCKINFIASTSIQGRLIDLEILSLRHPWDGNPNFIQRFLNAFLALPLTSSNCDILEIFPRQGLLYQSLYLLKNSLHLLVNLRYQNYCKAHKNLECFKDETYLHPFLNIPNKYLVKHSERLHLSIALRCQIHCHVLRSLQYLQTGGVLGRQLVAELCEEGLGAVAVEDERVQYVSEVGGAEQAAHVGEGHAELWAK